VTHARLPYTVRKRGKLFWQPTPEMKALGFTPKALGDDTPENQARALKLYEAWLQSRENRGRVTSYPAGTFGAYWDRYRGTEAWSRKKPRTREDYERAWARIDAWRPDPERPSLSRTVITQVTTELCEQFEAHLAATVSPRERWRTVKALKILLEDMVTRLRLGYASPAGRLVNAQPPGRWQIWLGAELEELSCGAAIAGFEGMSLAIWIAWETMFSPIDVWTLRPQQMKRDAGGWYFHRDRTKTEREAFAAISDELAEQILAYLGRQARAPADRTPIVRQRNGDAYRSKDTFGDDFRDVRAIVFPGDARQFIDIRRSANVEADAAGADKKTMGELLANGLAENRFLDHTYTPPTVSKARDVARQRLQGREKLAAEVQRLRTS
jgi:hypothetical protein